MRIVLAWKKLSYEYVAVDLLRGEQHSNSYRSKNPMEQVPVLELDNGRRIAQSLAIIWYLEETHPTPPVLPIDPYTKAIARQIAEIVNSEIQPMQNPDTLRYISEELKGDKKSWAIHWIAEGLGRLESLSLTTARRFMLGDEVTVADMCLVPQMFSARRFGVDLNPFPTLRRIERECQKLDAFQVSHPEQQQDANLSK